MMMTTAGVETCPEKYGNGRSADDLLACRCRETAMRLTSHHLDHPGNVTLGRSSKVSSIFSWPHHLGSSLSLHFTFLILISCCSSFTAATQQLYPPSIADPRIHTPDFRLALRAIAESGILIVDLRPPPPEAIWSLESEDDLRKRQNGGGPFSSSSASGSTASPTVAATPTLSGTDATGTPTSLPLPSPFDSFLDSNFTNPACPKFIHAFLANATFKACLPFSLLLSNSYSFFQAAKSIVRITQTLDATCAADVNSCTALMFSIAGNLTSSSNCGTDYDAQNPTVLEAYTGLIAYKPMYQASCLKNSATSAYCYADAITNASSPTDAYIYALPLNQSLPGGSQPTCNSCLQNTMAVFDATAANRSQPIASTYVGAAKQVNAQCGPNFVNASIPAPISAASSPILPLRIFDSAAGIIALAICLGSLLS